MGTNNKISQLCRMTRLTSSMWRGITLRKTENSVRSTKPPNNLIHCIVMTETVRVQNALYENRQDNEQ